MAFHRYPKTPPPWTQGTAPLFISFHYVSLLRAQGLFESQSGDFTPMDLGTSNWLPDRICFTILTRPYVILNCLITTVVIFLSDWRGDAVGRFLNIQCWPLPFHMQDGIRSEENLAQL